MPEHVFLVAVTMEDPDREHAQARLMAYLPQPQGHYGLQSWWIAEDDRLDGSDNDSAIFCRKGWQDQALRHLNDVGLTEAHNLRGDPWSTS